MISEFDIMNDVKNKLSELIDRNELFKIENSCSDGRICSAIQEKYIIDKLKELEYEWIIPNIRWWFDVALIIDDKFIPINIKITNLKNSDNIGNYSIIAYSMTDCDMKYDECYTNNILDEFMNGSIKFAETDRDYWFLIINKQTNGETVYINSFKGLSKITPNKSNLPFQINWRNNLDYKPKTTDEMFKLIQQSTKTYAESKTIMQKHIEIFGL